MTFDTLWEQVEREALRERLRREYPVWRRKQRQRRTALASVAVLLAIAIPILLHSQPDRPYDEVCCNRSGIADSHWAEVAGHVLTVRNNQL